MSTFEQYSANIPLFFPSKRFLSTLLAEQKVFFFGPYMKEKYPAKLESALGSNWIAYWLDKADYYQTDKMRFLTYYDSFEELADLLQTTDTEWISAQMEAWNRRRQANALQKWYRLIKPHYRPPSYKAVEGIGQINMSSELGRKIHQLCLTPRFKWFLEIGTWNGEGSTTCIYECIDDQRGQ